MNLLDAEQKAAQLVDQNLPSRIAGEWTSEDLRLYLVRCQVDTPSRLVQATWKHVAERREHIDRVVDFGAGDGRFAQAGSYDTYVGYEIDSRRTGSRALPENAVLEHRCAFSAPAEQADLCIGNPPFVRNQDLPVGWRAEVSDQLRKRTGIAISGLANAWQYFFLLSLASAKDDGLVALVIPYEWVSRPSAKALRDYITARGWEVDVYRLVDAAFSSVLTTASITIVDKAGTSGAWRYFEETEDGRYQLLSSASGASEGFIDYAPRLTQTAKLRAVRGLSPGTQGPLIFTEAERARLGFKIGSDVVPCVTSLRPLPASVAELDEDAFARYFRRDGRKCWLPRVDAPTPRLLTYFASVPEAAYQTATCLERDDWWRFNMPDVPNLLVATSFKGEVPKAAINTVGARAVGGVAGVYSLSPAQARRFLDQLTKLDIRDRIVAHANGLRKIEINQLNTLLGDVFGGG